MMEGWTFFPYVRGTGISTIPEKYKHLPVTTVTDGEYLMLTAERPDDA